MATRSTEPLLDGRYRVLSKLGTGGMATVVLAEDTRLGRRVAVKRLHADSPEDMARRFEREARLGALLNHPNVVSVFDIAADDEGVLIVMEYVAGGNLAEALAAGPLARERVLEILEGLAAALDHAHSLGVIHRDVKPANVLLGVDGAVKLSDLGIATAAEGTQITRTGTVLGTPSYMAPEQLEAGQIGPAVDVHALAAVAFEALAGRKARTGRTPLEIAHRAATEPAPDLREAWPDAPPAAATVLERGMARDPRDRQSTVSELVDDLRGALGGVGPSVTEAPAPTSVARKLGATPASRPAAGGLGDEGSGRLYDAPARRAGRRLAPVAIAAAALLVVLVAATLALSSLGGGGGDADNGSQRAGGSSTGSESAPADEGAQQAPEEPAPESRPEVEADRTDPTAGARLNDEGKALIDRGSPDEAVPVLEQSVASFGESTADINYAYALFNLGNALRLAGRSEEAIPILERRLEIDNQRAAVRAELELARQDAGGDSGDD